MYALSYIDEDGQYQATASVVSESSERLKEAAQKQENEDAEDTDREPKELLWAEDGDGFMSQNMNPPLESYFYIYPVEVL